MAIRRHDTKTPMAVKIVFLDRDTLGADIRLPEPSFPHEWVSYPRTAPDRRAPRLKGAQIAITNKVPFDADLIAALPDLRLIGVAATGTDIIDRAAAAARGIPVVNVAGYAVNAVPEHVFAALLSLRRHLPAYRRAVRDGAWQGAEQFCYLGPQIRDIAGGTLGIAGAGAIGQAVARRAEAFGMRVLFAERKGAGTVRDGYTAFDRVLGESDVLSLHCPLTRETAGLIDDAALAAMKPGAILINTGRGGLVDEEALLAALESGRLGGAALDVTRPEPPPTDSAIMRLAAREDVIVTPHIAWGSVQARQAVADRLIAEIERHYAALPG